MEEVLEIMKLRKYIIIISIAILIFSYCAPIVFALEEVNNNETVDVIDENELDADDNTNNVVITEEEINNNIEESDEVEYSLDETGESTSNEDKIDESIVRDSIEVDKVDEDKIEQVENNDNSIEVVEKNEIANEIDNSIESKSNEVSGELKTEPSVVYSTHIQDIGWQAEKADGQMSGTEGRSLRLEGIKISLKNISGTITYQTHIQDIGWQDEKNNGQMSGTEGRSLRLEAIRISLSGDVAESYNIMYRVHIQNYGWLDWAKNGETTGSEGYSYRLEGIEIKLVAKNYVQSSGGSKIFYRNVPTIRYRSHVQNIGWQGFVQNGSISGTTGCGLRLEAIQMSTSNTSLKGGVEYSVHVQNIGWQNFVKNGQTSGTIGRSLRIEAIKIRLTDELKANYDIYYRVHCQRVGWLDWAKNGESAGTTGYSYRMESIQIVIVDKNSAAPGSTKSSFVENRTGLVNIDSPSKTHIGESENKLKIYGWAISDSSHSEVKVYIDNKEITGVARTERGDVNYAYPQYAATSPTPGFYVELNLSDITNAEHRVKVIIRDTQLNRTIAQSTKDFVKYKDIKFGIDVSRHNARGGAGRTPIDWGTVKNQIDFAIVRCGYGQNLDSNGGYLQDDDEFYYNMDQCRQHNIPVEVYLYSYADNTTKASSEADHVIRMCQNYKDIVHMIWYDVEDDYLFSKVKSGAVSKSTVGAIVDTFANKLKSNGYNVGLYSYKSALQSYFTPETVDKYDIWLAHYMNGVNQQNVLSHMSSYPGTYVMWQYTSGGTIAGIATAVDCNLRFIDYYK